MKSDKKVDHPLSMTKMYSMQMNRIFTLSLIILCLWTSCKRVDDEPAYPATPISRLYISFSDLATSDTQVYQNAVVIDPADSAGYLPAPSGANTQPKLGMGITYSPDLKQGFQVSRDDTTIKYFSINDAGSISTSTRSFKDTVYLRLPRAIRYDNKSDQLFITNDDADTSSLSIYYNPTRLVGQQAPRKRIQFKDKRPWGLSTGMINGSDSLLLVSIRDAGTICGFKMHGIADGEQFDSTRQADYTLTIEGANDLRGIAYSPNLNVLVASDMGPTIGSAVDGKIYIIENATQVMTSGGTITPSRIITGSSTTLADPIDVAIAGLQGRNNFIYVADRITRRIVRFAIDATGNSAPEIFRQLSLTPEFIYLDARGGGSNSSGSTQ